MSFLSSHPKFSQVPIPFFSPLTHLPQDNQTENLIKQPSIQPKESTMSYTHYQNNNIRVFGTEITNLVRVENENNQNEDPNIQVTFPLPFNLLKSQ